MCLLWTRPEEVKKENYMILSLLTLSFSISSLSDRGIEDHANVSMLHGMPQVKVNKKVKRERGREGGGRADVIERFPPIHPLFLYRRLRD